MKYKCITCRKDVEEKEVQDHIDEGHTVQDPSGDVMENHEVKINWKELQEEAPTELQVHTYIKTACVDDITKHIKGLGVEEGKARFLAGKIVGTGNSNPVTEDYVVGYLGGDEVLGKKVMSYLNKEYYAEQAQKKLANLREKLSDVKTKWSPPEGFFKKSASNIATGLKKASTGLKQAMGRLNFYVNRAGKNLTGDDKDRLVAAKKKLHALYAEDAPIEDLVDAIVEEFKN